MPYRAMALSLWIALVIATVEAPLRYGMSLLSLDPLIFLRDAAIFISITLVGLLTLGAGRMPLSMGVFVVLAAVHGAIAFMNLHTILPVVYGLKLFVPALCGFLVFQTFYDPKPGVLRLVMLLWVITVIGAAVNRFMPNDFVWVGAQVNLGGIDVSLARDWQSTSTRRVGGLMRASINLAIVLPLLGYILLGHLHSRFVRIGIVLCTLVVLYWTTQKGAILAYAVVAAALALSSRRSVAPLRVVAVVLVAFMIFAPVMLVHYDMPTDKGVFSFESFIERITSMWPRAWVWIEKYSYLTGVGLGGIGGAQRFYAPSEFNAADNLFVYLYASFGVISLVYIALALGVAVLARVRTSSYQRDSAVLASFAFLMGYGIVISLVEDQVAAIWLGATLGALWQMYPRRTDRFGNALLPVQPPPHALLTK